MAQDIEKIYQKKTPLEHILLRPDTYIGSIEHTPTTMWVFSDSQNKIVSRNINYVPGLYKIFDEILVNAADNFQRDKSMKSIKVEIDPSLNKILVWNDGKGIPVQIHKEHKIYVPEMIFGHLLTGSNYNDNDKKVVGGRNGYGAKLANIFSTKFQVECGDSNSKKLFKMTWKSNMSSYTSPEISSFSEKDYTCITFYPDLKRFGMENLDDDILSLMKKRVYDMAGIFNGKLKVSLNKHELKVKSFLDYVSLYFNEEEEALKIYDKRLNNDRWEVILTFSDGQPQQTSFVNAICTSRGGTHVNYIMDQIVDSLLEQIKKKHKDISIKPFQVKSNLWVFVNALIENPAFDSQTKETLTTKVSQFGSKCQLSEKFIKEVLNSGVIDSIVAQALSREENKMARTLKGVKNARLLGITKLEDANDAGTKNSENCTLILTEGDSAKSLAMAGIEVIGRNKYGVFPLKGKLLNVRDASMKTIMENKEIQNIIKILGLQMNKEYTDLKSLRYGSLMIMTDQDYDGSHIKGLLLNFIHYFWPSLINCNKFLKEFATPIIKASKGNQNFSFFTIVDFKNWANDKNLKTWKIKYYKGLGTSTDKEAKEYFSQLAQHQLDFKKFDESDDQCIDLVFNKKKADQRKIWLKDYNPNSFIDHNLSDIRIKDFINREFIHFSNSDNLRSIPSIADGLKPGQRKILFSCFKRNLKDEIKVAQLSGYVAEHSAYHHGEISLAQTIVGMAQSFVGANNVNLLLPIGQFGTRNMGGKDHASSRYIYTNLSKITRTLFPEADDHLYKYLDDDGQVVEPEWYLPIIPTCLVNGADGIGTGWSTNIPCFDPRGIVESIKAKLNGNDFTDLIPFYKGFQGEIVNSGNSFLVRGKYQIIDDETIEITELPIKKWTKDYKKFLETFTNSKKELEVVDIREHHSNNRVHFEIKLNDGALERLKSGDGIEKNLKLTSTIQITNMVLFDFDYKIKKFNSAKEILSSFYDVRLNFYSKRKEYLLSKIVRDLRILQNKERFIIEVNEGTLKINKRKRKELCMELIKKGYTQMKDMPPVKTTKVQSPQNEKDEHEEKEEDVTEDAVVAKEFNYLLSMPLWSLTEERVHELQKQRAEKESEFSTLEKCTIEMMWINDMDTFLKVLDEIEEQEEYERINAPKNQATSGGKKRKIKKAKGDEEEKIQKPKVDKGKEKGDEDKVKGKEKEKAKKKVPDENIKDPRSTSAKVDFDNMSLKERLLAKSQLTNKEMKPESSKEMMGSFGEGKIKRNVQPSIDSFIKGKSVQGKLLYIESESEEEEMYSKKMKKGNKVVIEDSDEDYIPA